MDQENLRDIFKRLENSDYKYDLLRNCIISLGNIPFYSDDDPILSQIEVNRLLFQLKIKTYGYEN